MRKLIRIIGALLIAAGVLVGVWVILVWQWQDPFTALYTHFEQQHLARAYQRRVAAYRPKVAVAHANLVELERTVAAEARAYYRSLPECDPVGRLQIGRIGLNMVVVEGTDHDTLKKGPGHYPGSGLPGGGRLIYIAGHRTTYLAPFADIDKIRVGDYVTFALPYGTFTYRVFRHYVVPSDQLSVLEDRGREVLRLQACHPRFFATHRYLVDAKLVSVAPRGGRAFAPRSASS